MCKFYVLNHAFFFLFSKGLQLLLHPSIQSASGVEAGARRLSYHPPPPPPVAAPRPPHVLLQHWTSCFHRKSHLSSLQTAFKKRTLQIVSNNETFCSATKISVFVIGSTKVIHWVKTVTDFNILYPCIATYSQTSETFSSEINFLKNTKKLVLAVWQCG